MPLETRNTELVTDIQLKTLAEKSMSQTLKKRRFLSWPEVQEQDLT